MMECSSFVFCCDGRVVGYGSLEKRFGAGIVPSAFVSIRVELCADVVSGIVSLVVKYLPSKQMSRVRFPDNAYCFAITPEDLFHR